MKKFQGVFIKNPREIANLREADRITANILDAIGDEIRPGIPSMQLEDLARSRQAGLSGVWRLSLCHLLLDK